MSLSLPTAPQAKIFSYFETVLQWKTPFLVKNQSDYRYQTPDFGRNGPTGPKVWGGGTSELSKPSGAQGIRAGAQVRDATAADWGHVRRFTLFLVGRLLSLCAVRGSFLVIPVERSSEDGRSTAQPSGFSRFTSW